MTTLGRAILLAPLIAGALLTGTVAAAPTLSADVSQAPCYNGVFPLNPNVDNCAITPRPPRVLGSAPDQTALLNCSIGSDALRKLCLSLYVNGGYGWNPGGVLVPGYHP